MKAVRSLVVTVGVGIALFVGSEAAPITPTHGTRLVISQTADDSSSDQRSMIALVEQMIRDGDLRSTDRRTDALLPDRTHERFQQTYQGLPIIGADVALQRRHGQVISTFGIIYRGLALDVTTQRSVTDIAARARVSGFAALPVSQAPTFILPTPDGGVSLVYAIRDDAGNLAYIDANNAAVLLQLNEFQAQTSVGPGTGVLGDPKKMSTIRQSGGFVSQDGLRPPALETYDLRGDGARALNIANGLATLSSGDLARSSNNTWSDGGVVDAHVYAGWVYDYYYKRYQRRGLDDNNVRIQSIVNPLRPEDYRTTPASLRGLFVNAFYSRACRCLVYGPGLPAGVLSTFPAGVRNFAAALDVVAHELTHAVTDASSRLVYANESGALNEAFSDIMGTSVEFFHQPPGNANLNADYLLGEDLSANREKILMRSMRAPNDYDQPDHYWYRAYIGATRHFDGGGVHYNSGIANNAFYLAIEGGTHGTSRLVVTGVGAANRDQIERVFYRAFTSMLPTSATFYLARVATIQSARDLYGPNSAAERAVASAWSAVGVIAPAAALTTTFLPPVVPASNASCGGARPSFTFRVAVSEFQRVGFTVNGFDIYSFDAAGREIAADRFTASTFRSWFNECQAGNVRIGPGSTACTTLCGDLGGRSSGAALFLYYGTDDNGHPGYFNSDYVLMGSASGSEASDTTYGKPGFSKAVQQ